MDTQQLEPIPTRAASAKTADKTRDVDSDSSQESNAPQKPSRARRGRPRKPAHQSLEHSSDRNEKSATHLSLKSKTQGGRTQTRKTSYLEASSSAVTLESLHESSAADDSPDELLLHSPNQVPVRSSTPMMLLKPRADGTPRVVLDAVEITTPVRLLKSIPALAQRSSRTPLDGIPKASSTLPHSRLVTVHASPTKPTFPHYHKLPHRTDIGDKSELPTQASPPSPSIQASRTPFSSPRKGKTAATPQASPSRIPRVLPPHLHASLAIQKRVALRALSMLAVPALEIDNDDTREKATNDVAYQQLSDLLRGTIERGEGNSCLVIGPRGSGKSHVSVKSAFSHSSLTPSQIVERALTALPEEPMVVRLSGHAQINDRLAIREIARQLAEQTGKSLFAIESVDEEDEDADENPFLDEAQLPTSISLPPPSHLLALISMIPTLPRATVIVLDAFDLFALHARQALLYCLLDTVQSCRVGQGCKGLAVIGLTCRVDTINMLEKRVKSRFSGRMLRTACPSALDHWVLAAKEALCTPIHQDEEEEWTGMWERSIEMLFDDRRAFEALKETFSISHDLRMLSRILVRPLSARCLMSSQPFSRFMQL